VITQFHAEAADDFCRPVQRKIIGVLRHDLLRQQTRYCRALSNRLCGIAHRLHRAGAGVPFALILDYDQLRRDVLKGLAGLFAKLAQVLRIDGAMLFRLVPLMNDSFALLMPGQRSTATRVRLNVSRRARAVSATGA
jgi:hypothetical protein